MDIISNIEKNLVQTAVYWGSPESDGEGGYTWDDPIELDVRWVDTQELVLNKHGEEVLSKAKVVVSQDVDEEGYLYLGSLDESALDSDADPRDVDGAERIILFRKIPRLGSTTRFYRIAYLTSSVGMK